jgi:hypothetical protein
VQRHERFLKHGTAFADLPQNNLDRMLALGARASCAQGRTLRFEDGEKATRGWERVSGLAYIITDENNSILRLEEVEMFGRPVTVVAMFTEEEDALEVLYGAEKNGLKGYQVRKVLGTFPLDYVQPPGFKP